MGRVKKVGPTRGLGPRYGATVRKRYVKVISELKKAHKCPRCSSKLMRRQSVGVWECKKCGFTFTGGAYTPVTKLGIVARRISKSVTPDARIEKEKKGFTSNPAMFVNRDQSGKPSTLKDRGNYLDSSKLRRHR